MASRNQNMNAGIGLGIFAGGVLLWILYHGPTSGQIGAGSLTAVRGQSVTDTRASSKNCVIDGGLVVLSNNQPCVESPGLLVEPALTNIASHPNNLNTAPWSGVTSPTVTEAFAAGPEGNTTANQLVFASVAAGGQSTRFQSFTASGITYNVSIYTKRTSGTGSIYVQSTNASSIVYSMQCPTSGPYNGFGRCTATGLATAGTWYIIVGVKGDTDAQETPQNASTWLVADAQIEPVAAATSFSTSRAADVLAVPAIALTTKPSFGADVYFRDVSGTPYILQAANSSTDKWSLYLSAGYPVCAYYNGTNTYSVTSTHSAYLSATRTNVLCSYDGANLSVCLDGVCTSSAASFTSLASSYPLQLGGDIASTNYLNGWMLNVCAGPNGACHSGVQSSAVAVAVDGDSITAGTFNSAGKSWPSQMAALPGRTLTVTNTAVAGNTTTNVLARWESTVRPTHPAHFHIAAGTNDCGFGGTATLALQNIQQMADECIQDGCTPHISTLIPRGNAVGWTAGMQTCLTTINAGILSYCTSMGLSCADTYSVMGDTDPTKLKAAYDSGDGTHPNDLGASVMAATIRPIFPP